MNRQLPDATMIWTAPDGQTYTTYPGSRIPFPSLCRPTAPVTTTAPATTDDPGRNLAMPRRKHTRAENRRLAIDAERRLNNDYLAQRNKPPPY